MSAAIAHSNKINNAGFILGFLSCVIYIIMKLYSVFYYLNTFQLLIPRGWLIGLSNFSKMSKFDESTCAIRPYTFRFPSLLRSNIVFACSSSVHQMSFIESRLKCHLSSLLPRRHWIPSNNSPESYPCPCFQGPGLMFYWSLLKCSPEVHTHISSPIVSDLRLGKRIVKINSSSLNRRARDVTECCQLMVI